MFSGSFFVISAIFLLFLPYYIVHIRRKGRINIPVATVSGFRLPATPEQIIILRNWKKSLPLPRQ
jgi:hypothetical protein